MSFWAIFCAFRSLTTRKIKILEKRKNNLEMSSFYTYQNSWSYDVCSLKYGVWQTFCHFGPFFALYPTIDPNKKNLEKCKKTFSLCITQVYYEWRSYYIWFLRYKAQERDFLSFWVIFCPLTLRTTQEIKIFKKNGKNNKNDKPGDIIIWHLCTTNDDMMYGSWNMEHNRQDFSHFAPFLPFYPPNKPENQKLKKKKDKSTWRYISFYTSVPKIMIICYNVPEIWHVTDVIIFHFGPSFALSPTTSLKIEIS